MSKIDLLIHKSLLKLKTERTEQETNRQREEQFKTERKEQIDNFNGKTRVHNYLKFKHKQFRPTSPWGAPSRSPSPSLSNKPRRQSLSERRHYIGLEGLKFPKKNRKSMEKEVKTKREYKSRPEVSKYMKKQKKKRQSNKIAKEIQREEKENRRIQALKKLDRQTRSHSNIRKRTHKQIKKTPQKNPSPARKPHSEQKEIERPHKPILQHSKALPQLPLFSDYIRGYSEHKDSVAYFYKVMNKILLTEPFLRILQNSWNYDEELLRSEEVNLEAQMLLSQYNRSIEKNNTEDVEARVIEFNHLIDKRNNQLNELFEDNIKAIKNALYQENDKENSFKVTSELHNLLQSLNHKVDESSKEIDNLLNDMIEEDNSFTESMIEEKKSPIKTYSFIEEHKELFARKHYTPEHSPSPVFFSKQKVCQHIGTDKEPVRPAPGALEINSAIEHLIMSILSEELIDFDKDSNVSEPLVAVLTGPEIIEEYTKEIFNLCDLADLQHFLETPLIPDPLEMLCMMQEIDIGDFLIDLPQQPLLPDSVFMEMEMLKEESIRHIYPPDKAEIVIQCECIHNKMIFDCINQFLQGYRVYGAKGFPFPWSIRSRYMQENVNILKIVSEICFQIHEAACLQLGKLPSLDILDHEGDINDELLRHLRECKIDEILRMEADQDEEPWTDYEFEETQTKIDIGDIILEDLVTEIIDLLN